MNFYLPFLDDSIDAVEVEIFALKYLKTYLRSTMKEASLDGFALLYIQRNLNFNFEHVIDEFSRKNWRLNFK